MLFYTFLTKASMLYSEKWGGKNDGADGEGSTLFAEFWEEEEFVLV